MNGSEDDMVERRCYVAPIQRKAILTALDMLKDEPVGYREKAIRREAAYNAALKIMTEQEETR